MNNQEHASTEKKSNELQELRKELQLALDLIKQLKHENDDNLKRFTHDLASPLQILSMTIESIQDTAPPHLTSSLERMRRSADNMVQIISSMRKIRSTTAQEPKKELKIV